MSFIRREFDAWATVPENEIRTRGLFRQVVFVAIVLAVWISTRPFYTAPSDGSVPAADPLNQVTFSGLAVLAVLGAWFADHRALKPVLQPSYLLLVLWMGASVFLSTQFAISFRAFAFTAIVMLLAASLFVLPQRFLQFQNLFLGCALVTMGLAYFGVIAMPDLGRHTDFDPFEPEHAGSWKGHFDHKNIAGAAMASFAIMGLYALRIGWKWTGAVLLVGGVVFLYFTKSKTALGLLPLAMILGIMAERIPWLIIRAGLILGPVALLLVLTLGGALIPELGEFYKLWMRDPTFTGRFDIWRYGFEMLAYRPWTGYGFEGFWQTSTTLQGESRLELAWEVEKIIHGHNSYLDVALTMGLPGLALTMYVFLVKPLLDYHNGQPDAETRKLATMFLMMLLFFSLGMCLETFYFRRADPVWFTLLVAVLGLRFTAVYPVGSEAPSPAGS
jgi:O-antigen ligase